MNRLVAMSVLSLALGANVTIVDLALAENAKPEPIKVATVGKLLAPLAEKVRKNVPYANLPSKTSDVVASPYKEVSGGGLAPHTEPRAERDEKADVGEYLIDRKTRIEIPVSSAGVNRISIAGDRILKIVGNEDEYMVEGDSSKGYVFLTSKLAKSERAFATIVSEKGVMQDVVFRTHTDTPSTIVLKHKLAKPTKLEDAIAARIRNIFAGRTKSMRSRSLNAEALENFPKAKEAIEYSTATHRYIWLNCLDPVLELPKPMPGIIAVAKQNNQLILVSKL